jgi:hypothetical protein
VSVDAPSYYQWLVHMRVCQYGKNLTFGEPFFFNGNILILRICALNYAEITAFEGLKMKRGEMLGFLKDVINSCGESIYITAAWLRPIGQKSHVNNEDNDYHFVFMADLGVSEIRVLKDILLSHNLNIAREQGRWVISPKTIHPTMSSSNFKMKNLLKAK